MTNLKLGIQKYFPHFLLVIYLLVFVWGAVEPFDRAVWHVENWPIVAIASFLTILYMRGTRFSNLAYALAFFLLIWHTIGGHYTFERVPFDEFNNYFGYERNMYDRVGHFSVGFYAFMLIEYLVSRSKMSRALAYSYSVFAIAFVAMGYEIIEWQYAVLEGGEAGAAFLGSQGDIWDAQKDMMLDTLGAVLMVPLFALVYRGRSVTKEIFLNTNNLNQKQRLNLEKIKDFVNKNGKIENKDVEKLCSVSDSTATRYLQILENDSFLIQNGERGGFVYYTKKA